MLFSIALVFGGVSSNVCFEINFIHVSVDFIENLVAVFRVKMVCVVLKVGEGLVIIAECWFHGCKLFHGPTSL